MRESAQTCFGRKSAIGTSNRSGGMGRNELSANAIAASTHLPYRGSENVSTYRTKRLRVAGAIISPAICPLRKRGPPLPLISSGRDRAASDPLIRDAAAPTLRRRPYAVGLIFWL